MPAICINVREAGRITTGMRSLWQNEVETLAYFDVVNFARRVNAPGWYSWGYNDVTCPPTSMYSAYNVIPGVKDLHLYLETGHWTYPEQQSERIEWLKDKCGK